MLGRIAKIFLMGLAVSLLTVAFVAAQAPTTISYQGRLTDDAGQPLTDPPAVIFAIYAGLTGGTALYTSPAMNIHPDANGVFTVELGPFAANVFDGSKRYLGIKVGSDAEMAPRQLLTSAPYSFSTANAAGMAASFGSNTVDLTLSTQNLASVKVTTPAPGYVVTMASGIYLPQHTNGTKDIGRFSISRTSLGLDNITLCNVTMPANVETSSDLPMPVFLQRVDSVGAGTYLFYFTGQTYSGAPRINRPHITAMYFPTAYGTVNKVMAAPGAGSENGSVGESSTKPTE